MTVAMQTLITGMQAMADAFQAAIEARDLDAALLLELSGDVLEDGGTVRVDPHGQRSGVLRRLGSRAASGERQSTRGGDGDAGKKRAGSGLHPHWCDLSCCGAAPSRAGSGAVHSVPRGRGRSLGWGSQVCKRFHS